MGRAQGLKDAFARGVTLLGLDRLCYAAQKAMLRGKYIRVVNYHGTPARDAANFDDHCRLFAQRFVNATKDDLLALVRDGVWDKPRPGIIVTFDDGLRDNYDVAAPILEKYDLRGWFFVPAEFPDVPVPEQAAFATQRRLAALTPGTYADARVCMTWDELRDLVRRGHVVGSHTAGHARLRADLTREQVEREVVDSRRMMAERLGTPCETFCWVGGERESYSAQAAAAVERAGYALSFMTCSAPVVTGTHPLHIHRTNIESPWPLSLARVHLSGMTDLYYRRKRKYVDALTRGLPSHA